MAIQPRIARMARIVTFAKHNYLATCALFVALPHLNLLAISAIPEATAKVRPQPPPEARASEIFVWRRDQATTVPLEK